MPSTDPAEWTSPTIPIRLIATPTKTSSRPGSARPRAPVRVPATACTKETIADLPRASRRAEGPGQSGRKGWADGCRIHSLSPGFPAEQDDRSTRMRVKKAVIPAAGLGTRFLPATKSQPKEMLPIVDKPAIQFVVEEAVRAGISDVLIISGRGKRTIEDHFDRSFELEYYLETKAKYDLLKEVREVSELGSIHYIRQRDPLGLGNAIAAAEPHVHGQPFA